MLSVIFWFVQSHVLFLQFFSTFIGLESEKCNVKLFLVNFKENLNVKALNIKTRMGWGLRKWQLEKLRGTKNMFCLKLRQHNINVICCI